MMAIETSPASGTQGAQANPASHALKNRGKASDSVGGAFLALLSSLGSQASDAGLAAMGADAGAASDAALKDNQSGSAGQPGDSASLAAAAGASAVDPAVANAVADDTASSDAARAAGRSGPYAQTSGTVAWGAATGAADGQAAATAGQDASLDAQAPDSIAELLAGLKVPSANANANASGGADADMAAGMGAAPTSTVRLAARSDDPLPASAKAAAARATQAFDPSRVMAAVGGLARAGSGAGAPVDPRDGKSVSTVSLAQGGVAATASLQAPLETRDASLADKGGDKPGSGNPSWIGGGIPGAAERGPGAATGAPGDVRFADVAASQQLTPDEMLAQQVSVWATGKTQAAELKLDGFGDQPIEISIALNGNEAEVAFRSDHALARDLLQSSLPELQEMMRNEGLVLSGMTVSTSDRGAAEAGGRQTGREGQSAPGGEGRRDGGAAPNPVAPARATPPQGVLDVFA
jgi:flagellar hook-length control protein FliK